MAGKPIRVLIPFNTVSLYGMEHGVIETFDLLRPEVEAHFLLSQTTRRLDLPVLDEIRRRGLKYSFFNDDSGWVRVGKPRSLTYLYKMLVGVVVGNIDVFKARADHDMIYLPSTAYFYFAMLACLMHRLSRRRILYHFHDALNSKSLSLRFASLFVTDFVHNTQYGLESARQTNSYLTKKRNFVIPYPTKRVSGPDHGSHSDRLSGKRNIVFIGQVANHKGVDILLDAFSFLSRRHHDVALNLIGGCDDPVLIERLQRKTVNNGCEVRWWGYQSEIGEFLKAAYLYVQPSPPSRFNESFGLGLVEAMSLGIPAVCFKSGAFIEIMVHEETGLICHDEEPKTLADNFDRLLCDVEFRNHCGQRARQRYLKRYSPAQTKLRWLEALEEWQ